MTRLYRATALIGMALLISCSPTRGCVEANFELAPESRLPTWVHVPNGARRADVSVELYSYATSFPVENSEFTVAVHGQRQTFWGRTWWHPETKKIVDGDYANLPPRPKHPGRDFHVVEVDGTIDVLEFREHEQNRDPMRALFWMAEDPEILREAEETKGNAAALSKRRR